ncbi:PTS sugar transporter subunit IIB [Breznakia pachnodae]|uniref:PTS system galactitol-specific IIB component n=1 Tax=Breznakia pachnodae TaxID=265178 RepID=A0ABU0E6X1_9FIRM|nr:PTS sugar transporter subunit IIB [Breznakia pachnodae]MDQ0362453.1 PTS system galactitol-specific IIB component [Breznakia pachnodae]
MRKEAINILVACGSGVATSTLAADEVKKICEELGLNYKISKSSMVELRGQLEGKDLVLTTNNFKEDLGVRHMSISAFITGIRQEKLVEQLKEVLLEIANS